MLTVLPTNRVTLPIYHSWTAQIQFLPPPGQPFHPQRFATTLTITAESVLATVVVREHPLVVYLLPEPVLTSKATRQGTYDSCRMVHNRYKPFEGSLVLQDDANPSLFRGVTWRSSPNERVIQGTTQQTKMTIPIDYWRDNTYLNVEATILFALPDDPAGGTVPKQRTCEVLLNFGPNGTLAAMQLWALPTNQPVTIADVIPQHQYRVVTTGWQHHSTMFFSVWFSWGAYSSYYFRLSLDNTSTESVITIPVQTEEDSFILLVRATDIWGFPYVSCAACAASVVLPAMNAANHTALLWQTLQAPWWSLVPLLNYLALIAHPDLMSLDMQAMTLDKVQNLSAVVPADLFIAQTAHTWWAHTSLRVSVTAYDVDLCRLFNVLVTYLGNVTELALTGTAWLYGTVMRRQVYPLLKASQDVWDLLPLAAAEAAAAARRTADGAATLPTQTDEQVEIELSDFVFTLMKAQTRNVNFRDFDCMQADPLTTITSRLCFTLCSVTAYRDEFGDNYSRLDFQNVTQYPNGGVELLQYIVANRGWFDAIAPALPDTVTLASVRLGADCNFDGPRENLRGELWRLWLLHPDTLQPVSLPTRKRGVQTSYPMAVPIASDPALQDCMAKADLNTSLGYHSLPRSPLNGFCLTDVMGWVSVTEPYDFPAVTFSAIPWYFYLMLVAGLLVPPTLGALWALLRYARKRRLWAISRVTAAEASLAETAKAGDEPPAAPATPTAPSRASVTHGASPNPLANGHSRQLTRTSSPPSALRSHFSNADLQRLELVAPTAPVLGRVQSELPLPGGSLAVTFAVPVVEGIPPPPCSGPSYSPSGWLAWLPGRKATGAFEDFAAVARPASGSDADSGREDRRAEPVQFMKHPEGWRLEARVIESSFRGSSFQSDADQSWPQLTMQASGASWLDASPVLAPFLAGPVGEVAHVPELPDGCAARLEPHPDGALCEVDDDAMLSRFCDPPEEPLPDPYAVDEPAVDPRSASEILGDPASILGGLPTPKISRSATTVITEGFAPRPSPTHLPFLPPRQPSLSVGEGDEVSERLGCLDIPCIADPESPRYSELMEAPVFPTAEAPTKPNPLASHGSSPNVTLPMLRPPVTLAPSAKGASVHGSTGADATQGSLSVGEWLPGGPSASFKSLALGDVHAALSASGPRLVASPRSPVACPTGRSATPGAEEWLVPTLQVTVPPKPPELAALAPSVSSTGSPGPTILRRRQSRSNSTIDPRTPRGPAALQVPSP
eukprot:EG_transcript_288